MGGSVGGALAGAAAPYLAQTVKKMTEDDPKANLMAHAVLGAVLARAGGNSALAGAAGAVVAEKTAQLIKEKLYGDVSNENLTQEQKQTISSLSTLAAGLSGSLVGKDALNAVAAAQVGKNAVENNLLSPANESLLQKARDAIKRNKYTVEDAKTLIALDQRDQISDALVERLRRNPDSMSAADKAAAQAYLADYANALVAAYGQGEADRRIYALMRPGPLRQSNDVAYAAGGSNKDASLERLYPGDLLAQMNRSPSENEQLYREALKTLRIGQNYEGEAAIGTPALYVLGGGVGLAIRLVTAESGILQTTYGGVQTYNGDSGDGAQNIFLGLLNASAAGLPSVFKGQSVVGGVKGVIPKNESVVGAIPDAELGILVDRNVLQAGPDFAKGPKETSAPVVGGLDLSKVDVLTIKDARKLEGENKGLIFVQEPQGDFSKPFVKFEAGTTGAFSDVLSQRKAVPAIRFDNPNPNGNNFVKFDGVEDVDGITLIDRKTALTSFDKQIQSVQRVSNALKQNPGIKAVFEFPSQKAADRATNILIEQNIRNITVRVAP
jgi:filamentous hemagglutinin